MKNFLLYTVIAFWPLALLLIPFWFAAGVILLDPPSFADAALVFMGLLGFKGILLGIIALSYGLMRLCPKIYQRFCLMFLTWTLLTFLVFFSASLAVADGIATYEAEQYRSIAEHAGRYVTIAQIFIMPWSLLATVLTKRFVQK